ncbi:MAG: rhomboid family intramembrane serine protease [Planctomycetota bacterium]|nr:rhomboid family intramembrane serine protease [Planctomycetota bacterium]MDA1212972.1 rhomboid family intramembrane serine protease [Planctomycetota bacterium]
MFPIRDTIPSRHQPVAMGSLIFANALIFFLELQLPQDAIEEFFKTFGVVPALITQPGLRPPGVGNEVYGTLFTSMFLHGGWLHLISNMWIFYIFGDNVEDRMGIVRFLAFYLLCGVVSALVHIATNVLRRYRPSARRGPSPASWEPTC